MVDTLIHVFRLALIVLCVDACCTAPAPECGCVFKNDNPIPDEDYICDPIHSPDAARFRSRMKAALVRHWAAYTFIYSFPDKHVYPEESGKPICRTNHKRILGYWKDYGVTLCLVVRPDKQVLTKAVCGGEACCNNTICEPGGLELTSYLVYCDVYYTKRYGGDPGCLVGTDVLLEYQSPHVPEDDFIDRSKRDVPGQNVDDTERYYHAGRQKRFVTPVSGCEGGNGYFEFRHDYFPSTCSCRNCDFCLA